MEWSQSFAMEELLQLVDTIRFPSSDDTINSNRYDSSSDCRTSAVTHSHTITQSSASIGTISSLSLTYEELRLFYNIALVMCMMCMLCVTDLVRGFVTAVYGKLVVDMTYAVSYSVQSMM